MKKHIYFREDTQELIELPLSIEDINCYYLGEFGQKAIDRIKFYLSENHLSFNVLLQYLKDDPKAKNIFSKIEIEDSIKLWEYNIDKIERHGCDSSTLKESLAEFKDLFKHMIKELEQPKQKTIHTWITGSKESVLADELHQLCYKHIPINEMSEYMSLISKL